MEVTIKSEKGIKKLGDFNKEEIERALNGYIKRHPDRKLKLDLCNKCVRKCQRGLSDDDIIQGFKLAESGRPSRIVALVCKSFSDSPFITGQCETADYTSRSSTDIIPLYKPDPFYCKTMY